MDYSANHVTLRGSLYELPAFSHENHGKRFYRFSLEVERLSGTSYRWGFAGRCCAPWISAVAPW